jgi:hypothetical protein
MDFAVHKPERLAAQVGAASTAASTPASAAQHRRSLKSKPMIGSLL